MADNRSGAAHELAHQEHGHPGTRTYIMVAVVLTIITAAEVAVAYVPDPKAKGLDVVVGAWAAAGIEGARLEVFGIDPDVARAHLRRTGVAEPESLDLRGTVPAAAFRGRLRRARAFVHGARWEDWKDSLHLFDYVVAAAIVAGVVYLVVKWRRGRGGEAPVEGESTPAEQPADAVL